MILAFCVGPAASRCGLCDIDKVKIDHVSKMVSPEIRLVISQMQKPKLSVYFRRAWTSKSLSKSDLYSTNITNSTSTSCRTQTVWAIRDG